MKRFAAARLFSCFALAALASCAMRLGEEESALANGGEEAGEGAAMEMAQYVVALLYRGPNATSEVTPEVMELQAAHLANISRLAESGDMALAGPFGHDGDLRGLFFFNVATVEEAEALVNTDPAIQAGRLRAELYPWWGPAALATAFIAP